MERTVLSETVGGESRVVRRGDLKGAALFGKAHAKQETEVTAQAVWLEADCVRRARETTGVRPLRC